MWLCVPGTLAGWVCMGGSFQRRADSIDIPMVIPMVIPIIPIANTASGILA